MDPEVATEVSMGSDVTTIDPDVIIISDDELEEKLSSNGNDGPIVISDEENSSDMYDITTPEVSLTSDDEDSNREPENPTCEVEYIYTFSANTCKRKPELEAEELNIEQKKIKMETETGIQNITTVHDMIIECKKMLPSNSKDTSFEEEVDFSKDIINESSQEIGSDIDSVKLALNENTSNDVTGNSDKEIEFGEASDNTNEENCVTDLNDLSKTENDLIDGNDALKNEMKTINEEKQKDDLIDGNDALKNEMETINEEKQKDDLIDGNDVLKNEMETINEEKQKDDSIDGYDVLKNEMETINEEKQKDDLIDANNIAINEKDQNNESNVSKNKNDFIEENNVTKNEKSISNLKRNKYSSKESLFNIATDPDEEITSDI